MVTMGPVCLMKLTRKYKLIRTLGFFFDFFPQLISTTGSWDKLPVHLATMVTMGPMWVDHLIIVSLQVLPFEFLTLNVEYWAWLAYGHWPGHWPGPWPGPWPNPTPLVVGGLGRQIIQKQNISKEIKKNYLNSVTIIIRDCYCSLLIIPPQAHNYHHQLATCHH